jgi:ectoine hydroxylase-related dioxygenase (phytanoyl-CoA dioxygenase family)
MYDQQYVEALNERAGGILRRAVPDQLPSVGRDAWIDAGNEKVQEVLAARRSAAAAAAAADHGNSKKGLNPLLWAANDPDRVDAFNPDRVTYLDNLHTHDAAFDRHLRDPKLVLLLSELLGEDIDCYQCCTVVKPPRHDNEQHGWHQDITYYGSPTFSNRSYRGMTNFGNLCCITYLHAASPDRGATSVIPGVLLRLCLYTECQVTARTICFSCLNRSDTPILHPPYICLTLSLSRAGTHRTADRAREGPLLLGSSITPPLDLPTRWAEGLEALLPKAVTPTYQAGDVLLFDSWVLHRANSNVSDENMVGLVNVYCRPDCVPLEPPPTPHAQKAAAEGAAGVPGAKILRGGKFVDGGGGGGGGGGPGQCYGGGAVDARALL